jgi:hypothetical protein
MFRMAVYREEGEVLVAASDADLVGTTLEEGPVRLRVTASFYGEDRAEPEELIRNLAASTMANLVGEDVVDLAVEGGYVDPETVVEVDGVPHAQVALVREE